MTNRVKLVGLDFGTTTSSAVVALASVQRTATGRMQLEAPEEIFRSELVFTPMRADGQLDLPQLEHLLDGWLAAGDVQPAELFGGGALLTGLTAQKENAAGLVGLIRRRLGGALVATADDPCLESWLAFMGSCAPLARAHPDRMILNLDIGGGTTNIAVGQDRQVIRTGCFFLGARHVQVQPGTYRIVRLSPYAREIFTHQGIDKKPGDDLSKAEVDAFLSFYLSLLEALCRGDRERLEYPGAKRLIQVSFALPADVRNPCITFSGGVGELIYRVLQGTPWPPTTCYGDLGVDLAQRIAASPVWEESLRNFRPHSAGRATVYGLLQHATEVSGSTLFLRTPSILPLADVPILGRLGSDDSDDRLRDVLTLVCRSSRGGCVQVRVGGQQAAAVRALGDRLARILDAIAFPPDRPFVMLVQENVGKVLGQYVTRWGALPLQLLVIDEIPLRDAQYVQIGRPQHQIVPVSFYGLNPDGGDS
jgi:ethanolamine utilization protein EutA